MAEKKIKKQPKKTLEEKKMVKPIVQEEIKEKGIEEVKESETEPEKVKKDKPKSKKTLYTGTGRRKTSIARVFLYEDKGEFLVNDMKAEEYFSSDVDKIKWEKPFHAIGISHPEAKYSATIKVSGSGKSSQIDAVVLGISRALSKIDIEFDKILRKQGFMTRDSRMVERKKPFLHKARKRPQYSKR